MNEPEKLVYYLQMREKPTKNKIEIEKIFFFLKSDFSHFPSLKYLN